MFFTHDAHHTVVVAANGEIYNYKELYEELGGTAFYKPKTGSDCEVRTRRRRRRLTTDCIN